MKKQRINYTKKRENKISYQKIKMKFKHDFHRFSSNYLA